MLLCFLWFLDRQSWIILNLFTSSHCSLFISHPIVHTLFSPLIVHILFSPPVVHFLFSPPIVHSLIFSSRCSLFNFLFPLFTLYFLLPLFTLWSLLLFSAKFITVWASKVTLKWSVLSLVLLSRQLPPQCSTHPIGEGVDNEAIKSSGERVTWLADPRWSKTATAAVVLGIHSLRGPQRSLPCWSGGICYWGHQQRDVRPGLV